MSETVSDKVVPPTKDRKAIPRKDILPLNPVSNKIWRYCTVNGVRGYLAWNLLYWLRQGNSITKTARLHQGKIRNLPRKDKKSQRNPVSNKIWRYCTVYVLLRNCAISIDSYSPANKFYSFIIFSVLINAVILILNCLVLILYLYIQFLSLRCYFIALIHPIQWAIAYPVGADRPAKRQKKTSCVATSWPVRSTVHSPDGASYFLPV